MVDEINQNVFAPKVNSIFCPEFGFRSDICSSDFKYLSKLGEGTFSTVYRAAWLTKKNAIVAIKVQNKSIILNKGASKQIKRESDIHKAVSNSTFIACYYDCWQTSNYLFTVMECVDGFGDLYSLWKENKTFSENAIRIYAAEIGTVLDFLRSKNVIYRDFKMENLALNYKRHIKLIDFGFAKRLMEKETASTICGTLQYMAPEVAKEQQYGFEVDWWCFGVVLYVISENQYPYSSNNAESHSELIYDSTITYSQTSDILKDLISKVYCSFHL
uniref:Protein kinase domain-containing protein n=1 Tax=Panagrolaimus sp. ES5 TaxID=591445 RepID=A0AC34FNE5_9BILA